MAKLANGDVKILAFVGMSGAGKTTAIEALSAAHIPRIYFGGIIYQAMAEAGIARTPDSERLFREEIRRKEGPDFVVKRAQAAADKLIASGQKRLIFDGLYSWTEYKILHQAYRDKLIVVAVVAPKALRRKRIAARPERPFNAKESAERDASEIENLEKGGPIAIADYYLYNEGSLDELKANTLALAKTIGFIQ